ncbi:HD domain-containing protein [Bacillus sp. THAF10]|uniref:HD domain-containing protein n=1 Tax=Bacillus sp. THAF10 TaxID=2587848 RepID=UPI001268C53F|nr:HD domain-containing protein [Bacillus sp. THAF10]
MLLYDELYGEYVIEDVLAELVRSLPVQRLKGVHQGGASYLVNPDWNVTRYEHSIGVMLLIRRLGGSVEEQIAGLLHDVSHTAFSHVIDLVLDYPEENYHELIFQKVIANSEIPSILNNYHYRDKDILHDDSKWTLLEQLAPELCADRIDYTLRDMYQYGKITLQEAHEFLEQLTVINGRIYIKDIQAAEWFVETYYKEVIDFFMNPLNVYGYVMLTDVLKTALAQNVLNEEDFLGTDQEILAKIKAEGSDRLPSLLQKISEKVILEENPKDYDIHHKGKVRLIDPSVVTEHGLVKASKLSEKIRSQGEAARCKAVEGIFLKVQKQ